MLCEQCYAPVTGRDRVKIEHEEMTDVERVVLEIGQSPMFFRHYGRSYGKIDNLQLCQGAESLRKNMPKAIDWRIRSSDEEKVKEYEEYKKEEARKKGITEEFDYDIAFHPVDSKFKGFEYELDRNGLIVTYFDVAYEGINAISGEKDFVVGEDIFPVDNLNDAIRMSQRNATLLDNIYAPVPGDWKKIEVPRIGETSENTALR